MKRGPYKLYMTPEGNGILPRSTFYRELKKYRCDATNNNNYAANGKNDDKGTNGNNQLLYETVPDSSNLLSTNNVDGTNASDIYNQRLRHEVSNSWIYNDDNDESEDIWFDAENSSLMDDFYMDYNNEHSQQGNDEEDTGYDYHKPLCKCSTITQGEALMMTLALGAEESLTWKTIVAILSMINTLFQNDVVPSSKYKLFQTLKFDEDILVYHVYCSGCHYYFGAQNKLNKNGLQCQICEKNEELPNISYFLTFDISLQLKSVLEDPEVQQFFIDNLQNKNDNDNNNHLRSMRDGRIYKKLFMTNNSLSDEYNFSYTFNTDGCQPSKSSKLSIWPIYITINELPSRLQFKHIITTGLWVDKEGPDMLLFLKPFVDEANKLSGKGIEWTLQQQQQIITSKFIPICAVVDSPARCKILNMKQYNGSYGCTFCEHPTSRVNNSQKYPMSGIVPKLRSDESIKAQMVLAGQSDYGNAEMGVWGPSPLMNLNYFDLVDGMSPDYMHAILLGVIKQHTEILLSSFGEDYYIGNPNQLEVINKKLMNFKHPTCITRSPRTIHEREIWKATEWRSWLLFYSLMCLKDILPQKYVDHLALLVEAIYILLSDQISFKQMDKAEFLILKYVILYQEYFGEQTMTYNVHLLLHVVKSVLMLGPLQCHNTFIFESENHFLMKLQKSPNHILIQIARRYMFQKALTPLKDKITISDHFSQFCERNLTGRLKNTFKVEDCILIGKGKEYDLNVEEQKLLDSFGKCKSFNRLIYNGKRYTSKNYRSCEKIDDSVILLKNGQIGLIKNICSLYSNKAETKIYIFFEEIMKLKNYFHSSRNVTVHNIQECLITKKLRVCEAKMISQPCILTSAHDKIYVIFIPPGCYGD